MKFSALLPMKGHSERIPDKNMRDFHGKPLYHLICQTLSEIDLITEVIINTDSEAIAEDALKNFEKVKIIKRPEELCGDMVSMNKIIEHDLQYCQNQNIIQTHSTNPLLKSATIIKALELYSEKDIYDSIFSVTRIQSRLYNKDMKPVNHDPSQLIRTQDLEPLYEENSNFYIFSKNSFFETEKKRIGKNPYMFEIDKLEATDIDEPVDFELALTLYKNVRIRNKQ